MRTRIGVARSGLSFLAPVLLVVGVALVAAGALPAYLDARNAYQICVGLTANVSDGPEELEFAPDRIEKTILPLGVRCEWDLSDGSQFVLTKDDSESSLVVGLGVICGLGAVVAFSIGAYRELRAVREAEA